jgi:hypothetical protein
MRKIDEILDLPLDPVAKDFAATARMQVTAAQAVFTTKVRVDEGSLKRRQMDLLPEILRIVAEEKQKLAVHLQL